MILHACMERVITINLSINDIACLHGEGDNNKSLYQLLPVVMKN
jgi:hypothetical protein